MSPYLIIAMCVLALAAVVFAIHRIFPSATVASVEAAAKADAIKAEAFVASKLPDIEADAMAAGQRFMAWITDTSEEIAAKAKADASIAKKDLLRAQAAAALAKQIV